MRASKKSLNRVVSLILLLAILLGSYNLLSYCMQGTGYGTYLERDIEKIEDSGETVDLLFIGASRLYHSMVPTIFEEKLGYKNVLVAATASQPICGTYYYLKELMETVHPKRVVIDVTWDRLLNEITTQPCLLVYDKLSFKNKIEFAWNCIDKSDWKYLLNVVRNRDNVLSIPDFIKARQEAKANNYETYSPDEDYYAGNGFIYSYSENVTGSIPIYDGSDFEFSEDLILATNVEYLNKCIELCKDNNVDVALISGPCSLSYMYFVEGYDDAVQWFKQYAVEHDVTYYNLNYIYDRENILPDELIYDNCHVNGEGAYAISEIYSDLMLKEQNGEDISQYFYSDFDSLKKDVKRIVSVKLQLSIPDVTVNENGMYEADVKMSSLKNEDIDALYKIMISYDDGNNYETLLDWTKDENAKIYLKELGNFKIKVTAKSEHDGWKNATQVYSY